MKHLLVFVVFCCVVVALPGVASAGSGAALDGVWRLLPEKSTDLASWRSRVLRISISTTPGEILVLHDWLERNQVAYADTFRCVPGGGATASVVVSEIWPDNWFMGVLAAKGSTRHVTGLWEQPGSLLRVTTVLPVRTSQGATTVTTTRRYQRGPEGRTMILTEQRSGRPTPVVLTFERLPGQ